MHNSFEKNDFKKLIEIFLKMLILENNISEF